ncbi:hypothetical protein M426DRAFT_57111 [Hypoxylon sp. CI-4A]|nr:hypothetical protein M426DRAFT_57111 [Hypoxylon sp. CI-4A]
MDTTVPQKKPVSALSTSSMVNQSCPKKIKLSHESSGLSSSPNPGSLDHLSPMDPLLEKLSNQRVTLQNQGQAFSGINPPSFEHASSSSSMPITPATETFGSSAPTTRPASATLNDGKDNQEVLRLKLELAQAQTKINRLETEHAQSHNPRIELGSTIGSASVSGDFPPALIPPRVQSHGIPGLGQQSVGKDANQPWSNFDDSRSDTSDALSTTGFNHSRSIWAPNKSGKDTFQNNYAGSDISHTGPWSSRDTNSSFVDHSIAFEPSVPGSYRSDRLAPDYDMTIRAPSTRRSSRFDSRFGAQSGYGSGYNYSGSQYGSDSGVPGPSHAPVGPGMYSGYQPTPVGTPLSPLASEFMSVREGTPWKSEPSTSEGQTYLPTTEPLNYRRLLDRNVNCNWKYIVDKIVCNNDQQASIFLQQKLKVGTAEQKYEIVEAIVAQAYPLMVNRFGNFLVQRCFEHGTPEQVIKIAVAIRGNTLNLSMDPFGCHVIQKAFDSVPEDYKAIMVHELLRRIPETVIHRYACHVWQKLFELRWTESPPQIMKFVNDALRGMWHEVALGETGSLVVQNIFENCLEEDKRPCIEEVLANIDIISHGQFGNWCIQHICEHSAPADRSRAIDHVIRFAAEYSMDQYASKVVEKCLKIGGGDFLIRYLDRVCEGRPDRPRIPLIDISSDQYGNYLIQWILTHASPQHREIVAAHIRKHMVSLRGSKFGSRVGMLCTNPAVTTRPGPGVSGGMGRMPAGPRYSGRGYQ